jgi:hypothetical protein
MRRLPNLVGYCECRLVGTREGDVEVHRGELVGTSRIRDWVDLSCLHEGSQVSMETTTLYTQRLCLH